MKQISESSHQIKVLAQKSGAEAPPSVRDK